jgi:hypothetical protein
MKTVREKLGDEKFTLLFNSGMQMSKQGMMQFLFPNGLEIRNWNDSGPDNALIRQ